MDGAKTCNPAPAEAASCCSSGSSKPANGSSNHVAPNPDGHTNNHAADDTGIRLGRDPDSVRKSVQHYYGEVIHRTEDLRTNACCTSKAPPANIRDLLRRVPEEITSKYYGCGSPFPAGITGRRILDLGCGTGRDCYVCSALVGESGFVTGVDMTSSQLDVAKRHVDEWTKSLGYKRTNMAFKQGSIESLTAAGVEPSSVDIAISNCVINLSPDKAGVLKEVGRVLSDGGEMYFSDIYCDRRIRKELRTHPMLLGECLGGALYTRDFIRLCHEAGFADPRVVESSPIVNNPEIQDLLGDTRFQSVTYRLFKIAGGLETCHEDYGQIATYLGAIPGHKHAYRFDQNYNFPTNKPTLVDGNTATILSKSWLSSFFSVIGGTDVHYGVFKGLQSGASWLLG